MDLLSHSYLLIDALFSTLFSIALFFIYFYVTPRHHASMYLATAANHSKQYGTGPTLDVGDNLKQLEKWKHKNLMEHFLRLRHRIYLESEIHNHHASSRSGRLTDGPDGAQQAIALNIAGDLDQLKKELRERKEKEASRSWLNTLLWGLVGAVFYTDLFVAILFIHPDAGQKNLMEGAYPLFYAGLALTAAAVAFLGGRSWGDGLTLRRIEEEVAVLEERAKPVLAHANIIKSD